MRQDRSGVWHLTLDLPIGHSYEFRYLVDDRWLTDNHADALVPNAFGSQNSIIQTELPVALWQVEVESSLR